tara:strand:- start:49 stop:948 length:900 start_codon:yes stop_codon:yes gene_type:complete
MVDGVGSIALTGTSYSINTSTDGDLSDGHYKTLVLGGNPTGTCNVFISPNTVQKLYVVVNESGQIVVMQQGAAATVTIPNGQTAIVYADGAGVGASVKEVTGLVQQGITATTAELNVLDGITSSTDELNVLDGITSSTAELNVLVGITATSAELNLLDGSTPGTTSPSNAVVTDSSGDVLFSEKLKAKSYTETFVTLTRALTTTIDVSSGNHFYVDLSAGSTTFAFSNPPASGTSYSLILEVDQGSSSSSTISFPSSVKWALGLSPTLTVGASSVDVFVIYTHDGGTTYYGFVAGQDMS